MRHAATEVGHTTDGVEGMDRMEVVVIARGVDVRLVLDTHLLTYGVQVDAHRALHHTTVAHQTVLGHGVALFDQVVVADVLQHIDTLDVGDTQLLVDRTGVDAEAATGTGVELEHGVARLPLGRLLHSQLTEVDEERLGEDVHIAGEGHQGEEGAQRERVGQPAAVLEDGVVHPHRLQHVAEPLHHETSVVVDARGDRLAQQPQREDAPQGHLGDSVDEQMSGGTFHTQRTGPHLFEHGQQEAAQHIDEQGVHQVGIEDGLGKYRQVVLGDKEVVENGHPERMTAGETLGRLDGTHHYQEKPAESQAAVHVAQQLVVLGDTPMEQTLADGLPYGGEELPRKDVL